MGRRDSIHVTQVRDKFQAFVNTGHGKNSGMLQTSIMAMDFVFQYGGTSLTLNKNSSFPYIYICASRLHYFRKHIKTKRHDRLRNFEN